MYGRGGSDGAGGRGGGRRGGVPLARGRQGPWRGGGGHPSSGVPSAPSPTQRSSEAGSSSTAPASFGQPIGEELQKLTLQTQTPVVPPVAPADLVATPAKVARFPARPGFGTVGAKCLIRANHFLVDLEDRDMFHYDVSITPDLPSRGVNREVMAKLLSENVTHFGKRKPAYDGRKGFYTAGSLPFTSKDFVVKLIDKDRAGAVRREREFKVTVKLASTADIAHLREFLRGRHRETPHDTIQVLDIVLREAPSKKRTVVGRSFFGPDLGGKQSIGNGLECWKGFYQSIRPTQMGMSLNMDISVTSFYEPIAVIDFVSRLLNLQDPLRDSSRPLSDLNRAKVRKALKGVRVKVSHGEEKSYKIVGLTTVPTKQLTFPNGEQGEISVVQYFLEKYQIRLQFGNWPALQSGNSSNPIFLPMECCTIIEGQRYSKKLNERQVTALLREACKRPNIREANIERIAGLNNYENDDLAKEFGVNVKKELTCIESRLLPPPLLKYHDSGRDKSIRPRVGQWNMINAKLFNGATVNFWTCVNFSSLNDQMASGFSRDLVNMCRNKGMVISPTPVLATQSSHPNSIEKTIADIHTMCIAEGKPLQLLIVVLPDFTGSYGRIKRVCEIEIGIVSQCCQPKHAKKCSPQYLENVALKINVKAGGRNLVLDDALCRRIPLLSDHPTIIFGADVTHPSPGEDSSPSISAIVASMDWPVVTTYRGIVSAQQHREEIIHDCSAMVREQLKAFRIATRLKPERIIFYRDGVSEGQFSQVLLHETEAIRKACASLEPNYQPPITFVVVQKRHHTRFFATDSSQTDRSGNVLPGTVVDTKICHPSEFDFYLCSHAGIQGTSRPAHYHVLYDENKFTADTMQTLTNNLCYTYARCTRSVSVVPPAYYAHLAAFRARYYIEGDTGSDSASSAGGGGGGGGGVAGMRKEAAPVRPLPAIKENVKNVMFYC